MKAPILCGAVIAATCVATAASPQFANAVCKSDDVVRLDMRIVSDRNKTRTCSITTQFGNESSYKDIEEYTYRNERNELAKQEVGIFVAATPMLDDSGLIDLNMNVMVVDAPTEKKRDMTKAKSKGVKDDIPMDPPGFRGRSIRQRFHLSPGKPTVVEDGDLRVTVTPKIISSSQFANVACKSNDVVRLDMRIVSDRNTTRTCTITTQFGNESACRDIKECTYRNERNELTTRNVGAVVAATPRLDDSGLIKLYMNMIVVDALTEKKRGMTKSKSKGVKDGIPMEPSGFRVRTMHPILHLSPGKPTVIECGDLRVTVTPKIVSS